MLNLLAQGKSQRGCDAFATQSLWRDKECDIPSEPTFSGHRRAGRLSRPLAAVGGAPEGRSLDRLNDPVGIMFFG